MSDVEATKNHLPWETPRRNRPCRNTLILLVLACLVTAGEAAAQAPTKSLSLTVHGAAQQVGGSCFLLDADGEQVLLDCGLTYDADDDGGKEGPKRAVEPGFPFRPAGISALVLSHIHMDHAGRIPLLMKQGFKGPVHATRVTRDLARIMMVSCFLYGDFGTERFYTSTSKRAKTVHSRADCTSGSRIKKRQGLTARRPDLEKQGRRYCRTCARLEADDVVARFVIHRFHEEFAVTPRMRVRFQSTGHLPGSAMTVVRTQTRSGAYRVAWSGDYGGGDHPFLETPELLEEAQVLLVESTYGDKPQPTVSPTRAFVSVVGAAVRRGDRVLIPSFVLDRTQKVLAALGEGMQSGGIPRVPVIVTSPTTDQVTQAYLTFSQDRATFGEAFCKAFFSSPFHGLSSERKTLRSYARIPSPSVVVASSADGRFGATRDLLPHYAADSKATVVTVGWSPDTSPVGRLKAASLGKKGTVILDPAAGTAVPLRAHVQTASLSSHGSASVLARLAARCRGLRTLFLVHGEPHGLATFSAYLRKQVKPGVRIQIPTKGTRFKLF